MIGPMPPSPFILELFDAIKCIINVQNNWVVAAVGGLVGAYGGYYIVSKIQKKEDSIKEVRNTNAATIISFSIWNFFIGLKKQHVRDLWERYNLEYQRWETHLSNVMLKKANPNEVFELLTDFRLLQPIITPINLLQEQIFNKISLAGHPILALNALAQAIHSLSNAIETRNNLIETYRNGAVKETLPDFYFGLTSESGSSNSIYHDCVENILNATDDCIYFSHRLCQLLEKHADKIKNDNNLKIRINRVQFSELLDKSLLPDTENYADFENMFKSK